MLAAELALVWRSRQVDRWQSSDQSNWLLDPELWLHDAYCLGFGEYDAGYSLRFTRRFDRFDPKLSLDLRGQAGHEHEHLAE